MLESSELLLCELSFHTSEPYWREKFELRHINTDSFVLNFDTDADGLKTFLVN